MVEERSNRAEAEVANDCGPVGSENPDMSNEIHGENPCRRKDKVSRAKVVRPGLVKS